MSDGFRPFMTPQQEEVFDDDLAKYLLLYGGRASGKSIVAINRVVKHCHMFSDALGMITTLTKMGAEAGGAWEDLTSQSDDHRGEPAGILRNWKKYCEGFDYTEERGDKAGVKRLDIRAMDGGVSTIMLLSLPAGSVVVNRIKTVKPSIFLFEELTNTSDSSYFYKVIQQLRRRKSVPKAYQQYIATCNPPDDGPDHWVYKAFFEDNYDIVDGQRVQDSAYSVYCLNPAQNPFMEDREDYMQSVYQEARKDPTAYDRLVLGKWIAKVLGSGIFENYYEFDHHLKGELGKSGLKPIPYDDDGSKIPVIVGHDPGEVNNAKVFMQHHQFGDRKLWTVINEIFRNQERRSLEFIVRDVLNKMLEINHQAGSNMQYIHIGDKQGWDQYNHHSGSVTYAKMFEISKNIITSESRYSDLTPIYVRAPEKGGGSVEERVNLVRENLLSDDIMVSGRCLAVDKMFRTLRNEEKNPDRPRKTPSGEIHTFDALSYPMLYYAQYSKPRKRTQKKLEVIPIPA